MRRQDKDALRRAIEMAKTTLDPAIVQAVEAMLKTSWQAAGAYASYHSQMTSLRLRPWQCPPCDRDDVVDPAPAGMYGGKPVEVALRRRMIALGLSEFEPDPLGAIEHAEAKAEAEAQPAASEKAPALGEGKGGATRH
jgi:hypothetical protein